VIAARLTPSLDDARFVRALVVATPGLGLVAGVAAAALPGAWPWILGADLWLLSFPHVASTFTRTAFRADDRRQHRALLVALPVAAVALSAALAGVGGVGLLTTVYFFWQSFHYLRQSRGIHRALRQAAGRSPDDPLSDAVLHLVALWCLLHRCAQGPRLFFGAPLWVPAVPRAAVSLAAVVAFGAPAAWVVRAVREGLSEDGARDAGHRAYVMGHVAVFLAGYVVIPDATRAWIAVNVWHNAQYLLFVWAWNRRRFARSPGDGPLAWLCAPGRGAWLYAVCAALGGALYALVGLTAGLALALPLYAVLVQAVNFHHYVADTVLWRAPRQRASSV